METTAKIAILLSVCCVACGDSDTPKNDNENNIVILNNANNGANNGNNGTSNANNTNPNNANNANNVNNGNVYPFKNERDVAIASLPSMIFKCFADGDESANRLFFFPDGKLKLDDFEQAETSGTWEIVGDSIKVSLPEIGFSETTTLVAIDLDVIATLVFPSTTCGALVLNDEPVNQQAILSCDAHEWIQSVLIEDSEFQFTNDGYVLRRHWEKLLSIPDTIFSTHDGIWKMVDDIIYVVFPRESGDEDPRYLTMRPENGRVRVDEFSHPSGTELCEWVVPNP